MSIYRFLISRNIVVRSLLAVVVSLSMMSASADNQTLSVQQQIQALSNKIASLEKRVHQLETMCSADIVNQAGQKPGTPAQSVSGLLKPTYQVIENWTSLKRGLSEDDVFTLLGEPSHRVTMANQTMWYYQYLGVGSGSVIFTQGKHVLSWQKPAF